MLLALMLALQADLVERLGADDYAAREKADQALRAMGARAIPALDRAAESDDPEIAARAARIIDDIRKAPRPAVVVRIVTPEIDLSVSPAGVRLTAAGETYQARSMEAFRETYPEIAERHLKGLTIEFAPRDFGEDLPPEFREFFKRGRGWGEEFGRGRGRLGAHIGPVSETMRAQLGLAEGEGVMVERVEAGGSAERAGLREHDVIVAVDGETVGNTWTLRAKIGERLASGFELTVLRKAKRETLKIAPPERDE